MTHQRPNIVFIFADEWRAQATGYAGDPNCHTPNLDAFARESLNFSQATSGCSVCCPYRASLLTGQYPLTHGVFINDVELDPNCYSIARAFNDGGYRTAYVGKWHVYGSPDGDFGRREVYVPREYQLGFDYWKGFECNHDYNESTYFFNDDPTEREWEGYDAFAQSEDAAAYIRDHAGDDAPFMLMLSWGPPHFPLHTAPEKYRAAYENREILLRPNVPDSAARAGPGRAARLLRPHRRAGRRLCHRVATPSTQAGIAENTIFIFAADHGDMRQSQGLDTKLFPWDESVCVPFLLRWPKLAETQGQEISLPIDGPDVMPTLLGLCDLPIPAQCRGARLVALHPRRGDADRRGGGLPQHVGRVHRDPLQRHEGLPRAARLALHLRAQQRRALAALRQPDRSLPDEQPDRPPGTCRSSGHAGSPLAATTGRAWATSSWTAGPTSNAPG